MLGGGDEIGVDGLDVRRVGIATPPDHEPLDDGAPLVDALLPHHGRGLSVRRLGDEGQGHDRGAGEIVAGLLGVDVEQRPEAPYGRELGESGLRVDPDVSGMHGQWVGLGRRQARVHLVVDEQTPHLAKAHAADEFLNIDAAIAQRATLFVRFGDLGLEGDDAFEAGDEFTHLHTPAGCDHRFANNLVA